MNYMTKRLLGSGYIVSIHTCVIYNLSVVSKDIRPSIVVGTYIQACEFDLRVGPTATYFMQ